MTNRFFAGQTDYIEQLNALDVETGDHIADTTGAHAATAISNTPAGNIAAATVQAAINELDSEKLSATATTLPASFTASSLTSVGTLTALTVSGQSSFAAGTAAAPGVKVGAEQNGLYSSAANTLDVTLGGVRQFQFARTASAVNYAVVYGAATGGQVYIGAAGSDSTIPLGLYAKSREMNFYTGGLGVDRQFVINHTVSAVNYIQATGAATGGAPSFAVGGSDANIAVVQNTKGTGSHFFRTNGGAQTQFVVAHTASAVNYATITGAATGGYIGFAAAGSDTNIGIVYTAKGASTHDFFVRNGANFRVSASTDNAINYFTVTGQVTGFGPLLLAGGSDTNVSARYRTQGTGSHQFETGSSGNLGFVVSHTASAVNFAAITGGATGVRPKFYVDGTDANIGMNFAVKGTGSYRFDDGAGVPNLLVSAVTSAVNYPVLTSSATGNAVTISTGGSDTNRSISLTAAGTGLVQITNDSLRIVTSKTPASAAATGTQGQIAWDASYIYVCTANNTWKRAALATW